MRALRTLAVLALVLAPVLAGCGDDKAPEKPVSAWALPPDVAAVQAAPIDQIAAPQALIAWGGADDATQLAAGVQAFATQLSPMLPNVLDLAKEELRGKMALTKLDGVDWKRPARVAVFDPKGMPQATLAVALTLADKSAFLAALPATRKENDDGNAVSYRDDLGRFVYLSFVDDKVVITWEKKQFSSYAELLVKLARSTVSDGQAFFLSAKNVSTLYAKEIDEAITQQKQQMAQAQMNEIQAQISARVMSWMVSTFNDLDRVEVAPALLPDGARVALRLRPRADSALMKSFKAIEAHPHTLLQKIPADAPLFASFSTNPDTVDGLTSRLVEWAMSAGYGSQVPEGYAQAMKEYFAATTGEMVIAAHGPVAGDGLVISALMGVRDEEKLRAAVRQSKQIFKDKGMAETYKKAGVKVDYREAAYKVGGAPVDTVDMKFDKGRDPFAQFGPLSEALAELRATHTLVSKDMALIAYGKDARKTIEAFFGGKVEGGLDKAAGPSRALRVAVKDPVGILYVSPVELARRASLGGKNPLAESLKDIAGTTGVTLSFGAKDGVFELVLDMPTEQAKNIAQGAARAQAMMPR